MIVKSGLPKRWKYEGVASETSKGSKQPVDDKMAKKSLAQTGN